MKSWQIALHEVNKEEENNKSKAVIERCPECGDVITEENELIGKQCLNCLSNTF